MIFEQDYYLVRRRDDPEQYLALGWISGKLYSLIIEPRQDDHGEFYHLVTLWPSTSEEQRQYVEEH